MLTVYACCFVIELCEAACKFDRSSKIIPIVNNLTLKFPSFARTSARKSPTFCLESLNHRVWLDHRSSANNHVRSTYYEWMKTVVLLINQFKCQQFKISLVSFKVP